MGEQLDDPNRQAVGLAPAWEEGTGGGSGDENPPEPPPEPDLDAMTKDELIAEAQDRGLNVNATMTKAEIRAVIDEG
jgi:hypothetical protein